MLIDYGKKLFQPLQHSGTTTFFDSFKLLQHVVEVAGAYSSLLHFCLKLFFMDFIAMTPCFHCLTYFLLTRKEWNQGLRAVSSKSHQARSWFSILQCQQSHLVVFTVIYICSKWLKSSNFNCGELRIQLGVSHHTLSVATKSLCLYSKCYLGSLN